MVRFFVSFLVLTWLFFMNKFLANLWSTFHDKASEVVPYAHNFRDEFLDETISLRRRATFGPGLLHCTPASGADRLRF